MFLKKVCVNSESISMCRLKVHTELNCVHSKYIFRVHGFFLTTLTSTATSIGVLGGMLPPYPCLEAK